MSASIALAALDAATRCARSRRRSPPRPSASGPADLEHLPGQQPVHAVEVVAQRRPRQRLPAVGARQLDDPVAQPVELRAASRAGSRSPSPSPGRARWRPATSTMSNTEISDGIAGHAGGERRGHAGRRAAPRRASSNASRSSPSSTSGSAAPASAWRRARSARSSGAMSIGRGFARTSQRVARSTSRRPSISIVSWICGVDLVVERLDRRPERAHVEHLARDRVRARQHRRRGAGLLAQAERRTWCRRGRRAGWRRRSR